jgi:hypothetical protein
MLWSEDKCGGMLKTEVQMKFQISSINIQINPNLQYPISKRFGNSNLVIGYYLGFGIWDLFI